MASIPVLAVLLVVSGGFSWSRVGQDAIAGAGGLLFLGPLLMIVFRRKYPRWWFDWNLELQRFTSRVVVYLALMDDRYPSTDEQQAVHLEYTYPDAAQDLNRWLPMPLRILRSEGLVLLLLLFAPDLLMVGYARSARTGNALYNLAHSYPAPALLDTVAVATSNHLWWAVALVWFAHIGMDRTLGYGLKYDDSSTYTHLGKIGR